MARPVAVQRGPVIAGTGPEPRTPRAAGVMQVIPERRARVVSAVVRVRGGRVDVQVRLAEVQVSRGVAVHGRVQQEAHGHFPRELEVFL